MISPSHLTLFQWSLCSELKHSAPPLNYPVDRKACIEHWHHFNLWRKSRKKNKFYENKSYHWFLIMNSSKLNLTFNHKFSWTLSFAEGVDRDYLIFAAVLGSHSEDIHGAHTNCVGDVVVVVWVDADVVQVPGNSGCGASSDSACHEELVTFRRGVDF